MCDGRGAERPLPVAANAPDGAMGEEGLHTHPPTVAVHETTAIQIRYYQVWMITYSCDTKWFWFL